MAILSPMRFKNYVWPHNPRVYQIDYERNIAVHRVPFGEYFLQAMGRTQRILRGEGEFIGENAYEEFKKLACLFYERTPGVLVHPIWQSANAYLARLRLREEPTENYVAYSFEFWECFDEYTPEAKRVSAATSAGKSSLPAAQHTEETWYTAVSGDCLWDIARRHSLTLEALLALNPQIKNPNLLYVGDRVRVQ